MQSKVIKIYEWAALSKALPFSNSCFVLKILPESINFLIFHVDYGVHSTGLRGSHHSQSTARPILYPTQSQCNVGKFSKTDQPVPYTQLRHDVGQWLDRYYDCFLGQSLAVF